jgi:hypothetical protein
MPLQTEPLLSVPSPSGLIAKLDAWIAAQPQPRPTRAEAVACLLARALADETPQAEYRAARIGPGGPVDEWRAEAADDEDAAHRLAQRLKTRLEQRADGYSSDDSVTLFRPDGEIVTVAPVGEWVKRLGGWKVASADLE